MKTLVLAVTASLLAASAAANAVSAANCNRIVQELKVSASAITQNASSYWQHRRNFVSLTYGPAHRTIPNPAASAELHESQGLQLRLAMPKNLALFKQQIAEAQSQHCLSSAELSAITEVTIKLAKRVNFDQFPQEEAPTESSGDLGPPRMPIN